MILDAKTLAAIGAILLLVAIYLFPFGQDLVVLYLTEQLGSQEAAWTAMYWICFGLIGVAYVLKGHKVVKLDRLFNLMKSNPLAFGAILVLMYVIFTLGVNFI